MASRFHAEVHDLVHDLHLGRSTSWKGDFSLVSLVMLGYCGGEPNTAARKVAYWALRPRSLVLTRLRRDEIQATSSFRSR